MDGLGGRTRWTDQVDKIPVEPRKYSFLHRNAVGYVYVSSELILLRTFWRIIKDCDMIIGRMCVRHCRTSRTPVHSSAVIALSTGSRLWLNVPAKAISLFLMLVSAVSKQQQRVKCEIIIWLSTPSPSSPPPPPSPLPPSLPSPLKKWHIDLTQQCEERGSYSLLC